jgi:CspA family cold shock protein
VYYPAQKFIIMSKNTGTVKFFNDEKGYGFIKDDNENTDYFVHANNLVDDIRENDKVSYSLEEGKKGLVAVDVELVD